jgi:hypothetical protein
MLHFVRKTWLYSAVAVATLGGFLANPAHAVDVDKLIPADAESVVSIQFKQILEAPILKKFGIDGLARLAVEANEDAQKLIKQTGINPFTDIDSLTISSSGNPEKGIKAVVILRGKFNPDKISKTVEEKAKEVGTEVKKINEGGKTIWTAAAQGQEVFLAFVDNNAIVASTIKDNVISALKGGRGSSEKFAPSMEAGLAKLSGKDILWSVSIITEEARKQMASNDQFKEIGENLDSVTMTLGLTDVAKMSMTAYTKDEKTAGKIKDLITQQGIPFAKLMSSGDPKNAKNVGKVLDALKVDSKEKSVSVQLQVTEDDIRKMINPGE